MLLNVRELCEKHGIGVTGIVHIGAHLAEEAAEYERLTRGPIAWIEGHVQPQLREIVNLGINQQTQHSFYEYWVGNPNSQPNGFTVVRVASNGESTSLKMPLLHRKYHPTVTFQEVRSNVPVVGLDYFMQNLLRPDTFEYMNLLCMDVQGSEGDILESGLQTLTQMKAVYMEVNTKMLYAGLALLPNVDAFMVQRGFTRMDTVMTPHGWGDAFYVRN